MSKPIQNQNYNSYQFLKKYLVKYKYLLFLSIIFMLLFAITNPFQLWSLKPIIDKLFQKTEKVIINQKIYLPDTVKIKKSLKQKQFKKIYNNYKKYIKIKTINIIISKFILLKYISIYLIIIVFLKGLFRFFHQYILSYIINRIIKNIRDDLYEKIIYLSYSYHNKKETGDLISRFTNDITLLQTSLSDIIINFVLRPAEILSLSVLVLLISWKLTLISFIVLPLVGIILYVFGKLIRKWVTRIQKKIGDITQIIQETLSGIKIIKGFTSESNVIKKFNEHTEIYFKQTMKSAKYVFLGSPIVELFTIIGAIGVLWAAIIYNDNLSSGTIITFIASLMTMYKPIKDLTKINVVIQQIRVSSHRLLEILNVDDYITEVKTPIELTKIKKLITFNNISFKYNDEENLTLKKISFSVNPGKTVAIVGHSGSGKTTLVNLIPRFFDVTGGIISIDRINIKNFTLKSLRQKIAFVEQDVFLFNDTIAKNISYPFEPDIDRVIEVSKIANVLNFVETFTDKFDTVIGERGTRLSGGEKQRIAIARAIYKNAEIIILDEATSALDSDSEKAVQTAIDNVIKKYTTFVIAHRLSTIINSDIILVLKDGEIVEQGNHNFLLKKNGVYRQLYDIQFRETE